MIYKGKPVEVTPFFAYESSIPMLKNTRHTLDKKDDFIFSKLYDDPIYLQDHAPIGHLIINFKVKLHLPATEISINLD